MNALIQYSHVYRSFELDQTPIDVHFTLICLNIYWNIIRQYWIVLIHFVHYNLPQTSEDMADIRNLLSATQAEDLTGAGLAHSHVATYSRPFPENLAGTLGLKKKIGKEE